MQNSRIKNAPDELAIDTVEHIVCVFPNRRPTYGRAYNVLVEGYENTERCKRWGPVNYYRKLTKTEHKNLINGLTLAANRLRRLKLDYLLPMETEVRQAKGKAAGFYVSERRGENHHIIICPKSLVDLDDNSGIARIALHETAHPFWKLYMSERNKGRWITIYHSFNKIKELTTSDLQRYYQSFTTSKVSPSKYRRESDDEQKIIVDAILTWIKDTHHLELKFLDMLFAAGSSLQELWPSSKLHLSAIKIPVTDYSAKNPEELWCESFSFYSIGKKLPRAIRQLTKRTVRQLLPK